MNDVDDKSRVADRLRDLNLKATQLLTFLSFALVAAILLETSQISALTACQKVAVKWSLRLWVFSLFLILLIVLPIQEIIERNTARWIKVVLLEEYTVVADESKRRKNRKIPGVCEQLGISCITLEEFIAEMRKSET